MDIFIKMYGIKMEKITIKDIARLAGVSIATVSYITNGVHEERYTKETKQKVMQIINLYNFKPSNIARSFVSNKSYNVIILTGKHSSVLQKSESYDLIDELSKTFERLEYKLSFRTYLKDARVDTAEVIICAGVEEEKFLRLAKENFVPLLSLDGKINDELFFQVYQDFTHVLSEGDKVFGKGNYSLVLVDLYNEQLKAEIRKICGEVIFLSDDDLSRVPKGNVLTVNNSLAMMKPDGCNIHVVPFITQARMDAVIDCFKKATEREQGAKHTVLVK